MKKAIQEIFSDANGQLSSKRIIGALSFLCSIGMTIWVLVSESDTTVLMYPYTLTGGLFGFGVFEKKK